VQIKNELFSLSEDDERVAYAELIKNYPAVLKPQQPESAEKQSKTFHTPQDDERQSSVSLDIRLTGRRVL
jgi:hypothetical protein